MMEDEGGDTEEGRTAPVNRAHVMWITGGGGGGGGGHYRYHYHYHYHNHYHSHYHRLKCTPFSFGGATQRLPNLCP